MKDSALLDCAEPLSAHRFSLGGLFSRYLPFVWLTGACLFVGALLVIVGLVNPDSGTVLPGLVFAGVGVPFLFPVAVGFLRRARSVEVYEEGLRWKDGTGAHRVAWKDVREVYRMEKWINQTFRKTELRLSLEGGKQLSFDHTLSCYDQFAELVQACHGQVLLEQKRAEVEHGGAEFGPVVLRQDGLGVNGETFAWDDLEQYTVYQGVLRFNTTNYRGYNWKTVALHDVPNYLVLLRLMEELGSPPVETAEFFANIEGGH